MPKQKTSASAGTRKKHAKKAAKNHAGDAENGGGNRAVRSQTQQGKNKKLSKAQKRALPKIKQYVPPPKPPAPPIPNPLDSQGLAAQLPAELVVVLRGLGKKDDVTRRKALEELKDWVTSATSGDGEVDREVKEAALLTSIPVWLHNLASMLQSPFHRSLAIQLHTDLLSISSIRSAILESLSLSLLPGTQNRDVLGSWLVAALEEGRRAGGAGLKGWTESTVWIDSDTLSSDSGQINLAPQVTELVQYLELSILDPPSLHDDIHPSPVQAAFQTTKQPPNAKGKKKAPPPSSTPAPAPVEDDQVAEERWTRYRVGGLTGLSWLLQQLAEQRIALPEQLTSLLRNNHLWTAVSVEEEDTLGGKQPVVRRAGYMLLSTLVDSFQTEAEAMLETLAVAVLESCWRESEATVWEMAGSAIAKFLTKYRDAWSIALRLQSESSVMDDKAASAKGDARSQAAPQGDENEEDDKDEDDKDENDKEDENGEDEDDESDDDDEVVQRAGDEYEEKEEKTAKSISSTSFIRFLDFISAICPTIPQLTYPILLVVVSTIPESILSLASPPSTTLQTFFSHLWAPVDARLLATHTLPGQPSAFQIFLQDALDITCWMIRKCSAEGSSMETGHWLAVEQLGKRVWAEGVLAMGGKSARRGQAPIETEAQRFGKAVARLETSLINDLVDVMRETSVGWCFPSEDTRRATESHLPRLMPVMSAARGDHASQVLADGLDAIVAAVSSRVVTDLADASQTQSPVATVLAEFLVTALTARPQVVPGDALNTLVSTNLSPQVAIALLGAVSSSVKAPEQESLRHGLWRAVVDHSVSPETRYALALQLILVRPEHLLAEGLFDSIAIEATQSALQGSSPMAADLVVQCMQAAAPISSETRQEVLILAATSMHDAVDKLLHSADAPLPTGVAARIMAAHAAHSASELVSSDIYLQSFVAAHHLVYLLSESEAPKSWRQVDDVSRTLDPEHHSAVSKAIFTSMGDLLASPSCIVSPETLIDTALRTPYEDARPPRPREVLNLLLPPSSDLGPHLASYTAKPPSDGLYILDPLIPARSEDDEISPASTTFDAQGRSSPARHVEALLALLHDDRTLINHDLILSHVLSAAQLAQEALWASNGIAGRGLYAEFVDADHLRSVIREAEGAMSYALASLETAGEIDVQWHKSAVSLLKSEVNAGTKDALQAQLVSLASSITQQQDDVAARVLRNLLGRHLQQSGAGVAEAEVWLNFAMSSSEKQPLLSLAIMYAIKTIMLDTPPFETAQNRLANALTGISAANAASSKGLSALRLLTASAPSPDAASVFIPERRALFVLRHVESWLASDDLEDLSDELQLRLIELFAVIAPIVQSVMGAHWEMIFDLLENNLCEDSSVLDPAPPLFASLVLLRQIRELASHNKALRAAWTNQDVLMKAVIQLFTQCRNRQSTVTETGSPQAEESAPVQMMHDIILDLLSDVPESMMAEAPLPDLATLLREVTPPPIQCAAYRLMSRVIKSNTLALVLEVETSVSEAEDPQTTRTVALPGDLMSIVEKGLLLDWHQDVDIRDVLSQLLAWMAILDHFDDASRTLRWAYLDQLKSTNLLDMGLMPMLFAMLGVSEVGAWNFPANQYAVDEFYPDLLQPDEMADLTPLASHLFYRALTTLPSAMRAYHESLKDRQLSLSMLNFTARHYSPVIIAHEFAALRQPASMATLTEEGLNVKIAQGGGATSGVGTGSSEAIASYVVDEQPMEIGIRLPAEFPLKAVEIRDLRRVGVPENKWRGWLMSVQQTITSRNGLILEALTVFKKNVSLHFEGVVECAICYSIISLTDRTLPTKPCRTCKNRFHASCLYKWFQSSNSSSCPLCRALF